DPELIEPINGLASLYFDTRQLAKAEMLTLRCLALDERNNGAEHLVIAQDMGSLAAVYQMERRYREAEGLFLRAIEMFKANGGGRIPLTAALPARTGTGGHGRRIRRSPRLIIGIWSPADSGSTQVRSPVLRRTGQEAYSTLFLLDHHGAQHRDAIDIDACTVL